MRSVFVVRAMAEHLNNHVRLHEDGRPVRQHLRALLLILRIGISRGYASPRLNDDFQASLREHGNNSRRQRDSPLSWIDFFRDPNDHELVSFDFAQDKPLRNGNSTRKFHTIKVIIEDRAS